jgi:hypothetical protein
MNKRHSQVLQGIFADPVRANLAWREIESLLLFLGAEIKEGRGSRIRVALKGVRANFHRPHPEKEAGKGSVLSVRELLSNAGIQPGP